MLHVYYLYDINLLYQTLMLTTNKRSELCLLPPIDTTYNTHAEKLFHNV